MKRAVNKWWYIIPCVVVGIALAGFLWIVLGPGPLDFAHGTRVPIADFRGPNPTGVPAELASANLVERGQYLARAADCEACHTAPGGMPFAGGLAFVLPFGTLYSTNITPDPETGLGRYSDADFLKALHGGIDREGRHLYPAMPFTSYTYIADSDALAIKAYLFSLKPVHAPPPDDRLAFPFNQRWLMGIWSFLFNPDQRIEPNIARSAEWNHGAYLVEAMGHCGECHTPRNLFQAPDNRQKFAGVVAAGWRAYNITNDRDSGIGAFSDTELSQYLATGHANGHGTSAGPMAEAVDKSLSKLAQSDIAAMVVYLRSVPAISTPDLAAPKATLAPSDHRQSVAANVDPLGKAVFEGTCAGCHGWTGVKSSPRSESHRSRFHAMSGREIGRRPMGSVSMPVSSYQLQGPDIRKGSRLTLGERPLVAQGVRLIDVAETLVGFAL
jgi:mono/diheme cytochrome c family protein